MVQQLQENRFELKYIIDEPRANAIRDCVRGFLVPDSHADPDAGFAYPIHSVYLDNPGLSLFNSTVRGHKNRFKLRARYYDDNPASPVYLEIKRRVNDAILKKRAPVLRSCALGLITGGPPRIEQLLDPGAAKEWDALQDFCDLRDRVSAAGRVIVSYMREAWVTPDNNSVRLTMDRRICGLRFGRDFSTAAFTSGIHPRIPGVVLELKFTSRFPAWMRDAARIFNLQRTSCAKYVYCTSAISPGERKLRNELENILA
ncbi:MAG: VTC domain-containing protein [Tepidisphaerales bacterium]